jgi:hypothetical protein
MGIAPTNLDEGWRLAKAFAASELVPLQFRKKPEDVLVAIQMGIEIGFAPWQALQSIAVINGRPSIWGDGMLALVMASSLYLDHDEYYEVDGQRRSGLTADDLTKDTTVAVCTFSRRGKPLPVTRRFTIAHAKKARLWSKDGPWQQYPDRMLLMRARAFAARDTFPDLLRGIRTAEEVRDLPPAGPVIEAGPVVRRMSETPTVEQPPAPEVPHVEETILEPGRVKVVAPFLDEHIVTLSTGVRVVVPVGLDAAELKKFLGTDHLVRCTVIRGDDDQLYLKSFAIAD